MTGIQRHQSILYRPIGVVHSPFPTSAGMPIQSVAAAGVRGTIELDPAYAEGLRDLAEFSHLIVLTHLHLVEGFSLDVTPFLDDRSHGVFATARPSGPIRSTSSSFAC